MDLSNLLPTTAKHTKRTIDTDDTSTNKKLIIPNEPKHLIMHSDSEEFKKFSPFLIQKAIKGICGGEPKNIKKLKSGDLLIETTDSKQSRSLQNCTTIADIQIQVTPHKTLNSCQGVISEQDLINVDDLELVSELASQGVERARRITIKKDGNIIKTKHVILTFNVPKLPTRIIAGYLNCHIRPYIPNPLRCFKCQKYGHSKNTCRGRETCAICGSIEHPSEGCKKEPACVNCSESHPAFSKSCKIWQQEKKIQEIKVNSNISYPEAKQIYNQSVPKTKTFATVTKTTKSDAATQTLISFNSKQVLTPDHVFVSQLNFNSTISQTESMPSTSKSERPLFKDAKGHYLTKKASLATYKTAKSKLNDAIKAPKVKNKQKFKQKSKSLPASDEEVISGLSDSCEMDIELGLEAPKNLHPKKPPIVPTKPKK